MAQPILIVGAGLSGLSAAWHCQKLGLEFSLIEARDRLGGRALTHYSEQGAFDLGPSWVWRGQPHVARLLETFSLATEEQFCEGDLLHQTPDGAIHRNSLMKPMQHAQRIAGGVGALVSALAQDLPAGSLYLNTALDSLQCTQEGVRATLHTAEGRQYLAAQCVAFAAPPRLLNTINCEPGLAADLKLYLDQTPTWMAAQAKFFAVYEKPFWREQGLSGDAFSSSGVLAEVHDASSDVAVSSSRPAGGAALFGFVRLPAKERRDIGERALTQKSLEQLAMLFGPQAENPLDVLWQDWSEQSYTASPEDRLPLLAHPQYRSPPHNGEVWAERLHLIAAETLAPNGGLIEGALQRGFEFAQHSARRAASQSSSDQN